ncbi:MAG: hypothetical protein WCV00_09505 [Verrucomicrobiia bacterium]|jgi:hypothetical protein
MKRQLQTGQAMLELLVGIIAMIVILVGIITFGEGGYHWLTSMTEAAGTAWGQAISDSSVTLAQASAPQQVLQTWVNNSGQTQRMRELGLDNMNYTFQDVAVSGDASAFYATARQTLNESVAGGTYIDYLNYTAPYLQIQPVFSRAFNNQTTTSGWLIGQSTHRFALGRIDRQDGNGVVEFGSALQSLVYGRDSINLQSQVFLPPITNVQ